MNLQSLKHLLSCSMAFMCLTPAMPGCRSGNVAIPSQEDMFSENSDDANDGGMDDLEGSSENREEEPGDTNDEMGVEENLEPLPSDDGGMLQDWTESDEPVGPTILFADDFERESVFDGKWVLGGQGQEENFTITTFLSHEGGRSLQIHNSGDGSNPLQAITHTFDPPLSTGVVSVFYYDTGDDQTAGTVFSISNKDISQYIIFQVEKGLTAVSYRMTNQTVASWVPRSPGWHKLEIVVTEYGSYGRIDSLPLSNLGMNFELKEIATLNLGRGWAIEGDSYFDDVQVEELYSLPTSQQAIFDNWSDEVYRIYKNTDFTSLIDAIQGRSHLHVNAARCLAGQAMMHLYYHEREGRAEDLEKAISVLNAALDKFPNWKQIWGSGVTMNQIIFDAWWAWPELDCFTKRKVYDAVVEEADYWTWVINEIRTNPNGMTITEESGRRPGQTNLSLITSDPTTADHLNDTRAEENGWNGQFLATAYHFLPTHPNAENWNLAAKCFGFHVFSTGESSCEITTRTISDDFTLGNHNLWPSPLYTLAGITSLQQAQQFYFLEGNDVPVEMSHHIENMTHSEVWSRNVSGCMNMNYEITPECHGGEDWGDRNLQVASFILMYWAFLQQDPDATQDFQNLLRFFYFMTKDLVRYPYVNPVDSIPSYTQSADNGSLQWFTNIERHAQLSAKYYLLRHFLEPSFRETHFPSNPRICN